MAGTDKQNGAAGRSPPYSKLKTAAAAGVMALGPAGEVVAGIVEGVVGAVSALRSGNAVLDTPTAPLEPLADAAFHNLNAVTEGTMVAVHTIVDDAKGVQSKRRPSAGLQLSTTPLVSHGESRGQGFVSSELDANPVVQGVAATVWSLMGVRAKVDDKASAAKAGAVVQTTKPAPKGHNP